MEKKLLKWVGIIGVVGFVLTLFLGYIGFKNYQKFPLKARQNYNLGLLHDLHRSLKKQYEEFGYYCTDLSKLKGVIDYMSGHMNTEVKFGFTQPSESCEGLNLSPSNKDSDVIAKAGYINYADESNRLPKESFQKIAEKYCPDCTANSEGFRIIAFSNIDFVVIYFEYLS